MWNKTKIVITMAEKLPKDFEISLRASPSNLEATLWHKPTEDIAGSYYSKHDWSSFDAFVETVSDVISGTLVARVTEQVKKSVTLEEA